MAVMLLAAASPNWARAHPVFTVETVATGSPTFVRLRADGAGVLHALFVKAGYPAYPTYALCYGTLTGGSWTFEVINTSGLADQVSLAFDSLDRPHVAYAFRRWETDPTPRLMCAVRSEGAWNTEVVDSVGDAGAFASIAIDRAGKPHIAYRASVDRDLRYASRTDSTWAIETVDAVGETGMWVSLALDTSDVPHIAFYKWTGRDLRYATKTAGSWMVSNVTTAGDVGQFASLALDSTGAPRIAYYDATRGALRYAVYSGSAWLLTTVDLGPGMGQFPSLALDSSGLPHIAYTDSLQSDLRYASYDGVGWHVHIPDAHGQTGWLPSLLLDPDGQPEILFVDYPLGPAVRLARVAPAGSATIAGVVRQDCDGSVTPMEGMRVVLQLGGDPQDSTLTGALGEFAFPSVALGSYMVVVRSTAVVQAVPPETVLTVAQDGQSSNLALGVSCRVFSAPQNISNSASDSRDPQLILNSSGRPFAIWAREPGVASYTQSLDEGGTWSYPRMVPGQGRHPALALSDSGQVFIVSGLFDSVTCSRSSDGGINIDPAQATVDTIHAEYPSVATSYQGGVHIAWARIVQPWEVGDRGIFYSHSSNSGLTFSQPQPIAVASWANERHSMPKVVVAPRDTVYVLWTFSSDATNALWALISRSLDGGATFSAPASVMDTTRRVLLTDAERDSTGALWVMVNPTANPDSFLYLRSDDGGLSFRRVGGFELPWPGGDQEATVRRSGNNVHALIMGVQDSPVYGHTLYYTNSTDGGMSWSPLYQVVTYFGPMDRGKLTIDGNGVPLVVFSAVNAGAREVYFSRKIR